MINIPRTLICLVTLLPFITGISVCNASEETLKIDEKVVSQNSANSSAAVEAVKVPDAVDTENDTKSDTKSSKSTENQKSTKNTKHTIISSKRDKSNIVHGSGMVVSQQIKIGAVKSVRIAAPVEVEINRQQKTELRIQADDNIIPLVKISEKRGLLSITMQEGFRTDSGIMIILTMPAIDSLDVRGAADVNLINTDGDKLQLYAGGQSDITLSGKLKTLNLKTEGAANVSAKALQAENIILSIKGQGDAELYALNSISGKVAGEGDVTVFGTSTTRKVKVSGMAELEYEDEIKEAPVEAIEEVKTEAEIATEAPAAGK